MTRRQQGIIALIAITVVVAVVLVLVVGRGPSSSPTSKPGITLPSGPLPTEAPAPPSTPTTTALQRLADILNDMHQDAFNPQAPSTKSSSLPGGLFVNWRGTWDGDLSTAGDNTNVQTSGESDNQAGSSPRHDPVTDLMYMRNLRAYMYYAPNDHAFDGDAARMEPIVKAEFAGYTYYRAWIYFQLRDLATFDPRGGWDQLAHNYVEAVYKDFYNSSAGTVIDKSHDNYRTDFAAESAAAFADAGARYNEPPLTQAARSTAMHLLGQAEDPNTHLFPLQMNLSTSGGADEIGDPQIKMGEEAQTLDSLLTVYDHVRVPAILTAVTDAVNELYNPKLGIHDPLGGGFFFDIQSDGSGLQSAYKETRQAWMLQTLNHLNREIGGQAQRIAEMTNVVLNKMWESSIDGYVYRTTVNFGIYTNHSGSGHTSVQENFVTSEAMGIAGNVLAP